MISCAPSAKIVLPTPHEGSPQRVARDASDVSQQWKQVSKALDQIRNLHAVVETQSQTINKIRRRILGGSGGQASSSQFRGEYSTGESYAIGDMVVIRAGVSRGGYICIQANSNQAPQLPDIGNLYWVSLSGNASEWMV